MKNIYALDYFKGIAISAILWSHLGAFLGTSSWESLRSFVTIVLDWFGPTLYILAFVFGTLYSYRRKELLNNTKGFNKKCIYKSIYFYIVGYVINMIIFFFTPFRYGIWQLIYMNVITAIAFVQLLMPIVIKVGKRNRLLIGIILLIINPILLHFILTWQGYAGPSGIVVNVSQLNAFYTPAILYFILYQLDSMIPLMVWLPLVFISSGIFDDFITLHLRSVRIQGKTNKIVFKEISERIIYSGLAFLTISICAGGFFVSPGLGTAYLNYLSLKTPGAYNFWIFEGLPLFLQRHSPNHLVWAMGWFFLIFGLLYRREFYLNKRFPAHDYVINLGKYTFSLFVYPYALFFIPNVMSFPIYMGSFVGIWIGTCWLVWKWDKNVNGFLSLKWGLRKYLDAMFYLEKKYPVKILNTSENNSLGKFFNSLKVLKRTISSNNENMESKP
ncbi:MAG: hypothetical protein ACTSXP_05085 [Promethearchaeota archaeon]